MKKKFVISFIALLALGIFACKKKQDTAANFTANELAKHEAALAQIQQIRTSAATFKRIHSGAKTTKDVTRTVIGCALHDVGGAITGFFVGGKIGTFLSGPGGSLTGASAGIVLGAVIGSGYYLWDSYGSTVIDVNPPTPTWANGYTSINDQCGYVHDAMLVTQFSGSFSFPSNPNDYFNSVLSPAASSIGTAFGIDPSIIIECADTATIDTFLNHFSDTSTSDMLQFLSNKVNDANIMNYVNSFLYDFMSCDPSDTTDMYAFCDAYISSISSDTTLSSIEENELLDVINVAKYSLALWETNSNEF